MAGEIYHRHSETGETLYFTIRNAARQMWNIHTSDWESLTVANWYNAGANRYNVAMSETPASSYFYVGSFPGIAGNMIAGWHWVEVFEQAGANPAISDPMVREYFGYWDGTTFKWWADDTTHLSGTLQTARDIGASVLLSSGTGVGQIGLDSGKVTATATGDTGITLEKTLEMIAAFIAGKVSRSSDAGVTTLTYKKRDGNTTSFTAVCDEDDGDRATTGALS